MLSINFTTPGIVNMDNPVIIDYSSKSYEYIVDNLERDFEAFVKDISSYINADNIPKVVQNTLKVLNEVLGTNCNSVSEIVKYYEGLIAVDDKEKSLFKTNAKGALNFGNRLAEFQLSAAKNYSSSKEESSQPFGSNHSGLNNTCDTDKANEGDNDD